MIHETFEDLSKKSCGIGEGSRAAGADVINAINALS
jgi:hypothetical protein